MFHYGDVADEFYVNMHLNTEMELPSSRDTLLHYFEQLQKSFPSMRNFYNRDRADFVLEEDKDEGHYRWASVESKRVCSGYVNPPSLDAAFGQHVLVLQAVPHLLSVSPLDCESLDLSYCFEFNYRGNHHDLVCEALGMPQAFKGLFPKDAARKPVTFEPMINIALSEDCRTQCRLHVETKTTAYHVRTGEYPDEQIGVYLTIRNYGSLDPAETYVSRFKTLIEHGRQIMDEHVVEHILLPLQQIIAIK